MESYNFFSHKNDNMSFVDDDDYSNFKIDKKDLGKIGIGLGVAAVSVGGLIAAKNKKKREEAARLASQEKESKTFIQIQPTPTPTSDNDEGVPLEKGKKPKWVLPVAIGGGLLIIGVVVYFAMKKK